MADTISFGIKADDQTRRGFASVERGLNRLGGVAKSAFGIARTGALALTAAAVGLATATALLTKREAELIKEIKLVSDTTGIAVKQVAAWTEEYRRFGYEAEDVRDVLNELNVKQNDALAGTESAIEAFAVFGLSLQDIAGLNAHETLLAIADGFQTVEDHSRAAWAADAIFGGDMAQRTIPILLQGRDALLENARAAEMLGLVYDERAVAAAERFDRAQFGLGQQIRSLGTAIATAAMPHLTNLMNAFSAIIQLGRGMASMFEPILRGAISFGEGFDKVFADLPPETQKQIVLLGLNFTAGLNNMLAAIWSFGDKVETGFADVINDMLDSVDPDHLLGRATSAGRFAGAPPKVTAPQSIIDFASRTTATPTAVTTRGGGGQQYTVQAGDTLSGIAASLGVPMSQLTSQYGGDPRLLPIGTQFRYGGGGARTTAISPDRYTQYGLHARQDPDLQAALAGYQASLNNRGSRAYSGPRDFQYLYQGQGLEPTPYNPDPANVGGAVDIATSDPAIAGTALSGQWHLTAAQIIMRGYQHLANQHHRSRPYNQRGVFVPTTNPITQSALDFGSNLRRWLIAAEELDPTSEIGRRETGPNLGEVLTAAQRGETSVTINNITVEVNDTEDFITRLNDALESGAALPFLIQEQQRNE